MQETNEMRDRLIKEFAENYMEKPFYFCLKKTGSHIEAEDLTQDIALQIITALNKSTIPTSFSAWVWQIARNRYSVWATEKHNRNESVTGSDIGDYEIEDESENILDEMIHTEQMALLRRELAFIKSDYRNIVVAFRSYSHPLSWDIEEKIISMYAKGMTTNDISAHIEDIYGIEVSDSLVSRITDKILPVVKEWQQRPLESIYAVVFMDAIHYNVRCEGIIVKKAVYIAIGIKMDGKKDVLGMYVGENESARYWLSILNGLKNRGVEDILIACVDGLTGFPEAISAVYPKTEVQQCIVHQIRNSTKYVSYKDIKALMADLKKVYVAVDEETALYELEQLETKWDSKYPKISASWKAHWSELSTYFKYPQSVRTLIYTTNSIENFNRQLRKVSKNRSVFPNDDSLLKMLYLAQVDITRKWTGRRRDWGEIHSQLEIFFADRLPE